MRPNQTDEKKYRIEDNYRPSSKAFSEIGDTYASYYSYRNNREQSFRQLQHKTLEEFWTISRNLFWNSNVTPSEDLNALGLDFSLPFVRKEVLDFTGRLVSLNINPTLTGDALNAYAIKVLQGMYKKYRFKTQDKVEKFWQVLYSAMNGTVCTFVGFQMDERKLRYLTEYDKIKNDFKVKKEMKKMWDDAFTEIVPLEEIYLEKIWERDIQKQNRTIRSKEMTWNDFKKEYPTSRYKNCEYVVPGAQIAEDSLFFELLGGTQILNSDKVQVLYDLDTANDKKKIIANGVWLDELGKGEASPNPFHHKKQPYTWSMHEPVDDKFAYGMSMPFLLKDSSKILNTSYCVTPDTKILTRDLRWVEAETLKIGDKLIGFEEQGLKDEKTGHRRQRHWEEAIVTNTGREIAPVYKLTLEDGTELKATGNHRWLVWNGKGQEITWMRTDEMVDKNGVTLPKYFNVTDFKPTYESGYIAGLFDGEGSFSKGNDGSNGEPSRGTQLSFAQQDNACFAKGMEALKSEGYSISVSERAPQKEGAEPVKYGHLTGGIQELIRLLTETRPERLISEGWQQKDISKFLFKKIALIDVASVEYIGEQEIITLESSSKTYIAEGFGAHNTMLVERELRSIDPPVLSSDFEAPELIFGQQRVIPVNDVNAYKEFRIEEASGAYFTMMNSLQGLMSSFAQGGNSQIAPSKQPRSAREMIQIEKMKQQALGNTLLMYYSLVHQEIILLLKTMLQFYAAGKYNTGQNLLRAFIVPNSPLSQGNVGDLEVRFVKNPGEALNLYFEAIKKSIENGKPTEIIEMPVDMIDNLEFYIDDIKLEPEKDDEMERAMFNENILQPLLNVFIPAGVADINKTYVRWLEKQGEHPSSYTSEQQMPQIMSAWGGSTMQQNPQQQMAMAGLPGGMPQGLSMNAMTGRQGQGAMTGNLNQSRTGTQFGGRSNGGVPQMN